MSEQISPSGRDLERAGQRMVAKGHVGRLLNVNSVDDRINAIRGQYPEHVATVEHIAVLVDRRIAAGDRSEGVAFITHLLLDGVVPTPRD